MAGYVCWQCGRLFVSAAKAPYGVSFTRSLPFSAHLPHLRLTKEEIELLPVLKGGGATHKVIISHPQHETQYENYIRTLTQSNVLGFDTETKPSFATKTLPKPCLVQLASSNLCVMWRLRSMNASNGTFPLLHKILESEDIMKVQATPFHPQLPAVYKSSRGHTPFHKSSLGTRPSKRGKGSSNFLTATGSTGIPKTDKAAAHRDNNTHVAKYCTVIGRAAQQSAL